MIYLLEIVLDVFISSFMVHDGMEGINIESQSLLINKLDTGLCKKFLFINETEWDKILDEKTTQI